MIPTSCLCLGKRFCIVLTPKPNPHTMIFLSYRSDDCLDEARTIYRCFRDILGRKRLDPFFDDKAIQLTQKWREDILHNLQKTEIMLCLIGPDWVASFAERQEDTESGQITDWVQYEIETALAERIDIIPIFIKQERTISSKEVPEGFPPAVADILDRQGFVMPKGKVEDVASDVMASIQKFLRQDEKIATSGRPIKVLRPLEALPLPETYVDKVFALDEQTNKPLIETPFLGPTHFTEDYAALYFGRDWDIRSLYHKVRQHRLVMLDGYSGSGKSSLLRAGLLPRMRAVPNWHILPIIRRNKEAGGLHRQLSECLEYLPDTEGKRTLIILDQVEEMFTDPIINKEKQLSENAALKQLLADTLKNHSDVYFLLALRSEFQRQLKAIYLNPPSLRTYFGSFYVGPMDQEDIERAILGPAIAKFEEKWDYTVTDEMATEIARDFVGDAEKPYPILLQIQLRELWNIASKNSPDGQITFTETLYTRNKREDLSTFVVDQLAALRQETDIQAYMEKGLGLDILYSLTTASVTSASETATGYAREVFHEQYRHIDEAVRNRMLALLKKHYLVVHQSVMIDGEATSFIRLAHDTLAPIIRRMFQESDAVGQRARRIVEAKKRERDTAVRDVFSETDCDIILEGISGMYAIPDLLLEEIKHNQQRFIRLRQDRFELFKANAKSHIEHLQYPKALNDLRLAYQEYHDQEAVFELAKEIPYFFLEFGDKNRLTHSLSFLTKNDFDSDSVLDKVYHLASKGEEYKEELIHTLQNWSPDLYNKMQARHYPSMIPVEGGEYLQGDELGDGLFAQMEMPHRVRVSSFLMADTPVTFWQYGLYCQEMKKDELPGDSGFGRGDHPVINVNWYEAIDYCNWLSQKQGRQAVYQVDGEEVEVNWQADGYRLPTEAEWEFAARERGKPIRFGNGKMIADVTELNFDVTHPYNEQYGKVNGERILKPEGKAIKATTSVRAYRANGMGLYDMSGNVYEWCWDRYDEAYYQTFGREQAPDNPIGPEEGSHRVVRGGSWYTFAMACRCSYRLGILPINLTNDVGFRVVRRP